MASLLAHAAAATPPPRRTASLAQAAGLPAAITQSRAFRALSQPMPTDYLRNRENDIYQRQLQTRAQGRSNKLFAALSRLLGGDAPALNFVMMHSPLIGREGDLSANSGNNPGGPAGTINVDPLATYGVVFDKTPIHSGAINQLPHEMAHLRQTPDVLSSIPIREGGAQGFADLVAQIAAQRAGIPYAPGNFDAGYAGYVQQARQRGRDWLLAGQFGNTGSPTWP